MSNHEHHRLFADALKALRLGLAEAGAHQLAEQPTQDLLAALDRPYRALVAAQRSLAALCKRTEQQAEGDLYALAARIHRGLPQDSLCGACLSVVPSAGECPFCGAVLGEARDAPSIRAGARVHETSRKTGQGVGASIPHKAAEKSGTATPLALPPPRKSPGKRIPNSDRKAMGHSIHGRKSKVNEELARYARRVECCRNFPYTRAYLEKAHPQEVRQIAAAIYDGLDRIKARRFFTMLKVDLMDWIMANQPNGPKDPGPPTLTNPRAHRKIRKPGSI